MKSNNWIRQSHRWLSIAFTLGTIVNFIALGFKVQSVLIGLLAGLPLILLTVSGLYLFFRPYVSKWRGARHLVVAAQRT
jgi:hypothetical protein